MSRVAVFAGSGDLPVRIVNRLSEQGRQFCVISYSDNPHFSDAHVMSMRHVQRTIDFLKRENVTHVVFAGGVQRPSLLTLFPDWRGFKALLANIFTVWGDDGLLRVAARELEKDGISVIGAHEIVPEVLAPPGLLTRKHKIDAADMRVKYGIMAARALGRKDKGQAVIVGSDQRLLLENARGTDALIRRAQRKKIKDSVLVKMKKPKQDFRFDLPAIGLRTVENAHAAGIKAIVVDARHTIVLDQPQIFDLADTLGIAVLSVTEDMYTDKMHD